ncbi:hypothetical protein HDE_03545 [Halotydeus destructor]|nr:hypothetical protein HDE_03545 [Halotydeus destructor]
MQPVSLSAVVSPCPAIILRYLSEDSSKPRKRFMPVRSDTLKNSEDIDVTEDVFEELAERHPDHLAIVGKNQVLIVLRVIQKVLAGHTVASSVSEAQEEFKDYQGRVKIPAKYSSRKVSFKDSPDILHFEKDEADVVEVEVDEEEEIKIETNFDWDDEDDDEFVF